MSNEQTTDVGNDLDETGIDVSELQVDCLEDPVLVWHTQQMLRYENTTLLANYDDVCTVCLGDKRVLGHEHMDNGSGDKGLCKECNGTGRIPRGETSEDDDA